MNGKEKLEKWREQLLDTGKRNNLVAFRDSRVSTLEVLLPSSDVLFKKTEGNTARFEVFDPGIQDDEEYTEERKPLITEREEYLAAYGKKLRKQSQLLVFSESGKPIQAMRNIERRAREYIEETGVNTAYMAFGFIHWREKDHNDFWYNAPLLLIPISIRRENAISPYFIKTEEADAIVNPTFSFKLNAEYGIQLPEYEDEGYAEYLARVNELVSKLHWTVSDECKIGIFSFLKINMFQDLAENEELILENRNVRALLGEPLEQGEPGSDATPSANPLIDLYSVVDADSSQIDAIELARSGQSFVLQGPPGTGKSQTITNIIAECLGAGRKVLFVSEKLAALNVVYDKLKKAGLEEFCLELHSHKSSKKAVIDDLCRTLKTDVSRVSERAYTEIESKQKAQTQLDSYALELHKKREGIEKSLYQLFEEYSRVRDAKSLNWALRDITSRDADYYQRMKSLLQQYVEFIPSIGRDYRENAWYGFKEKDISIEKKYQLENNLKQADALLDSLEACREEVKKLSGCSMNSVSALKEMLEVLGVLNHSTLLTPAIFGNGLKNNYLALHQLIRIRDEMEEIQQETDRDYYVSIYELDVLPIYEKLIRQYENPFARIFSGEYGGYKREFARCRKGGKAPSHQEMVHISRLLLDFHTLLDSFYDQEKQVRDLLGSGYQGINSSWEDLTNDLRRIQEVTEDDRELAAFGELSGAEFEAHRSQWLRLERDLRNAMGNGYAALQQLNSCFDHQVIDLEYCGLQEAQDQIRDCMAEMDRLENYCQFREVLNGLREGDLESFLETGIREHLSPEEYVPVFEKKYLEQWINAVILSVPVLSMFSRISQDNTIRSFAEKDVEQFDINKARIRSTLSRNRPSLNMVAAGSAVSVLLREGEKKRKQKPIRKLLSEAGDLVQLLKPCFLMSPLSVSTFLDPGAIHFDVVVFDEASQIFPQDAIGAIYRGDQTIVVGDSRQMPPSNFFTAGLDMLESIDRESELEDVTDFESILDLCSTAMRSLRLKWHYRSRNEELIAFSNQNFYDNDLVTFPSSRENTTGNGVDYYHVDGLFDRRTHTNRIEAEFVADLIYRHIDTCPERSLGVVAFSVAQQNLIDSILVKQRRNHPEKEFFFSHDNPEPFFIKNLETVQGDERDTIIFSVAYGKDVQGKLLHNFGPLNRVGGERRLNVAVTRAKCNVQIVSSMHEEDIDLTRTKSTGARLLKEYLDFAENGTLALQNSQQARAFEQEEKAFETEVAEFLRDNGYTVDSDIGCSGYRIDLGIRRENSADYVMAVECDGSTYHSLKNARDRDRLRKEVLERMGWSYYRIWSTDWFRNNAVEKERLLAAAEEAMNKESLPSREIPAASDEDQSLDAEENTFEDKGRYVLEFRRYMHADIPSIVKKHRNYLSLVSEILETEAPMSEDWLLRRTLLFFGNKEKITAAARREYEAAMSDCGSYGIVRRNGFLYLRNQTSISFRAPGDITREVKDICPEELAAGLYGILKQNISAEKNGLFAELAKQCGYKRTSKSMNECFEKALQYLQDMNYVRVAGDIVTLAEHS